MRVLQLIVLAVAQLVGPWLCCCGPLAVAHAPDRPATTAAPVEDHGDCPHCKKDSAKPAQEQPARYPKTPKSPDNCPCCALMPVPLPADKSQLLTADALLVAVTVVPPEQIQLESVCLQGLVGLRELPLLSAEERLFAHHVLRC